MGGVSLHTLGCKLNQLESEAIALAFREYVPAAPDGGDAEIIIVNTCTVTSKAEQKARRLVRQVMRENPEALVIVTGCYAQLDGPAIAALNTEGTGRLFVVPGEFKAALLALPGQDPQTALSRWRIPPAGTAGPVADAPAGAVDREEKPDPFAFNPQGRAFHSRPSLKIQDGCDQRCAFCRTSLARGPGRSLAAARVLERLRSLEAAGAAEAVLTGLNIGLYRDGGMDLGGLLAFLLDGTERIALRLSSLEPGPALGDAFFEAVSRPGIRPHFHLSLQSLSAPVLERMGRRYGPEEALNLLARLRAAKGDPFLACDLIAGFPGEDDAGFDATLALAREADFAWIHAFPFSRRPGTAAFSMRPGVSEAVARSRVSRLTRLAREGRAAYAARQAGRRLEAVRETAGPESGSAFTENGLRVLVREKGNWRPGTAFSCRLLPLPPEYRGRHDFLAGEIRDPSG